MKGKALQAMTLGGDLQTLVGKDFKSLATANSNGKWQVRVIATIPSASNRTNSVTQIKPILSNNKPVMNSQETIEFTSLSKCSCPEEVLKRKNRTSKLYYTVVTC